MQLSAKMVRERLAHMKPRLTNCSLETSRKGQNAVGELMRAVHHGQVRVKHHDFENFEGAWVLPDDPRRDGTILYLHGGGYTCGGLEYALGFGAALADECGAKVFCAAYRLAPEFPFPAAVEDAAQAYEYLLKKDICQRKSACAARVPAAGCALPSACICGSRGCPCPAASSPFPPGRI